MKHVMLIKIINVKELNNVKTLFIYLKSKVAINLISMVVFVLISITIV